jgi:hypothetical protein
VVYAAEAFRLLPAPHESVVAGLERDVAGVRLEHFVQVTRGRAHLASIDYELRQPRAVERHQRVEQIEEDGFHNGFRAE